MREELRREMRRRGRERGRGRREREGKAGVRERKDDVVRDLEVWEKEEEGREKMREEQNEDEKDR